MTGETQRWDLTVRGRHHRVEVEGSVAWTIRWYVDGDLVASEKTSDDTVHLAADPANGEAVSLKFTVCGRPRRVTLFEDDVNVSAKARAVVGSGGIDLEPEPGSLAALRDQRIREHPWRHTAIATAGGVAKVVVPLLLGLVVVRFAISLPWPSWNIPWPDIDLPDIDLPDLPWPQFPWPDVELPDWQMPAWVRWLADKAQYVWPVLLAFALAMGEVKRRRKQDVLKAELKKGKDSQRGASSTRSAGSTRTAGSTGSAGSMDSAGSTGSADSTGSAGPADDDDGDER